VESVLPFDGEIIAENIGIPGRARNDGSYEVIFPNRNLDVRLVLHLRSNSKSVSLFVDRGKRRRFIGGVALRTIDQVAVCRDTKQLTFRSAATDTTLTIWADGRFDLR
jgi:hypothetical protein